MSKIFENLKEELSKLETNKVPKKEAYKNHIITIKENDTIKPRDLINNLINSGYKRVYTIEKQGEVSLRGSV